MRQGKGRVRTENLERLAVSRRPARGKLNCQRRKLSLGRHPSSRRTGGLPGVGDNDVVEGRVAFAEAREPYLENHCWAAGGWQEGRC